MSNVENKDVHILDYGAGNVRSLKNAVKYLGYNPIDVKSPSDLVEVKKLLFPGVGRFGAAMKFLNEHGYAEPLANYVRSGKPYFGICLGMQTLFEGSEEDSEYKGLGVIPGIIQKFSSDMSLSIPQIGWNTLKPRRENNILPPNSSENDDRVYFVHSFCARESKENADWILATTTYGVEFVSAVQKGNVMACQFHPEKSGHVGLEIIRRFLELDGSSTSNGNGSVSIPKQISPKKSVGGISKRVVACLDVRTNDDGDLVVTKGESYDVRESVQQDQSDSKKLKDDGSSDGEDGQKNGAKGKVRNLGKPVDLAARYYEEGADEVTFLNITSFRSEPLEDTPMLQVLEAASERVFVPLTIGGGIRDYVDQNGKKYSAFDVASRYFRAGADKVSIGGDAVLAAEKLVRELKGIKDGTSAIEQISKVYGAQAVVISFDPRRVYCDTEELVQSAKNEGHTVIETTDLREGSKGKPCKVWYQCTAKGGRENRNFDVVALAKAVQELGAGEVLLNSIDCDGKNQGFDIDLINLVCNACTLPVIASSGAGKPEHFVEVFQKTRAEAALAAGIFHRREVPISQVKSTMAAAKLNEETNIPVRIV